MSFPKTLYDKLFERHQVVPETVDAPALLYIDLQLLHEVTSPQAFAELKARGLKVRHPERCLATIDHSTPTLPPRADGSRPYATEASRQQVETLIDNARAWGITAHGWDSPHRGVVHVMGPELGAIWPGMTLVCGDSHTSTHGAFGALAFGVGTSEVGHVLATQCLAQRKSGNMAIVGKGRLKPSVTAKDLILYIISKIGVGGGTGMVIEYRGETFEALSMDERMTVCNMSIEAGARAGLIAPDQTTFDFIKGRELAPKGEAFEAAVADWKTLFTDEGAQFDKVFEFDAAEVAPMITWGVNPAMGGAIDAPVPEATDPITQKAFDYMGVTAGEAVLGLKVARVFLGSCTNGRLSDLKAAAEALDGHKVAEGVHFLVAPGSQKVKDEAEKLGLDQIFKTAGADWREPGCSMCLGMNGDIGKPGELVVSTSNRNFEGRQGPKVRTMLASPQTAVAAAITGKVSDPREVFAAKALETV